MSAETTMRWVFTDSKTLIWTVVTMSAAGKLLTVISADVLDTLYSRKGVSRSAVISAIGVRGRAHWVKVVCGMRALGHLFVRSYERGFSCRIACENRKNCPQAVASLALLPMAPWTRHR